MVSAKDLILLSSGFDADSTPAVVSSAILHFDATDFFGNNSNSAQDVTGLAWVDKSSSANNATVGGTGPTNLTDNGGGLWTVNFPDTGSELANTASQAMSGTSARTLFFVAKTADVGHEPIFAISDTNYTTGQAWGIRKLAAENFRLYYDSGNFATNTTAVTPGSMFLLTIHHAVSAPPADIDFRINGSADTKSSSGTAACNTVAGTATRLAGVQGLGTGPIDIGEILLFDSELSAGDISEVETWLIANWGIS